jgi:plastocyanin
MQLKKACLSALSILCIPALIVAGPGRGEITGEVTFTGTPAKPQVINMAKFPDCVKLNPKKRMTEDMVTGPGNALQNVVVYVSGGAAGTYSPSTVPAIFDQKDCHFSTHVLVFQPGQELQMSNHDPLAHNIHPMPQINREWNKILLPGTPPSSYSLDSPEFIPVKCNIHPWMRGYFVVLQTNYFAVTGEDGRFRLPELPLGKYTVTAWHEVFGTQSKEITVGEGQQISVDFVFHAKPQ